MTKASGATLAFRENTQNLQFGLLRYRGAVSKPAASTCNRPCEGGFRRVAIDAASSLTP